MNKENFNYKEEVCDAIEVLLKSLDKQAGKEELATFEKIRSLCLLAKTLSWKYKVTK